MNKSMIMWAILFLFFAAGLWFFHVDGLCLLFIYLSATLVISSFFILSLYAFFDKKTAHKCEKTKRRFMFFFYWLFAIFALPVSILSLILNKTKMTNFWEFIHAYIFAFIASLYITLMSAIKLLSKLVEMDLPIRIAPIIFVLFIIYGCLVHFWMRLFFSLYHCISKKEIIKIPRVFFKDISIDEHYTQTKDELYILAFVTIAIITLIAISYDGNESNKLFFDETLRAVTLYIAIDRIKDKWRKVNNKKTCDKCKNYSPS
ncbi:MAG: hypothetical protein FWG90_05030 [Oscillospiraceae bacterium]|nr:hypothetical protein [Oscillospiraceae bacterium]